MTDLRDRPADPAAPASPLHPAVHRYPLGAWRWALAAGWTLFVGLALLWNMAHIHESARDLALVTARSGLEKEFIYSQWVTMHGGVYATAATPRAREPGKDPGSRFGRVTSLRPIRPENAPDAWERTALEAFGRGEAEVASVEPVDGEPHLRLMRPLRAGSGCLKCHAAQGYGAGDLCGGISVAVPMKGYEAIVRPHQREELLAHGVIWVLGLVSLGAGLRQIHRRRRERDQAQAALRDEERRFRAIFEDSPVAIWEADFSEVKTRLDALRRSGVTDFRAHFEERPAEVADLAARARVLAINDAAVRAFRAESKEQVIRELPRYFTAESLKVFQEKIVALAAGAMRFRGETLHLTADGTPACFDLTASVEHGHEDSLSRVVVSFLDITERRRTEEALRESEARMNKAQEIAHVGSWELDLAANRLTWSNEVYRIFGLPPLASATTYEAFLDRVHPDDRAAVDAAYTESIRSATDFYEIDHRIVRKSTGEIRHVREKCQHVRDASGRIVRSVGMVHDITESRRAENELLSRNEELTRFNRAATNRELRMIELKREINDLCREAGEPPRYPLEFSGPPRKG